MGLISKIEDKLHSDKGGSSNESSKLQKGSMEDSSSSHLRHPVGSSGAAGTPSNPLGSSTGSTGATSGYGSSAAAAGGATGMGSGMGGSSGMPGSYDNAGVERDGYGRTSDTAGGYSSSKPQDVTSGGYGSSRTDPRDMGSSEYGSSTRPQDVTSGGYGSSGRTDPRDTATTGGYGREPREPYDPYSSKGQTTAANAAGAYPGGTSREDYGSSRYANDPNIPRSRDGGIMNPGSDPAARNPESIPTAGGQRVGSTSANDPYSSGTQDPYSTSTTQSSGHPIRDAAMYGGAGAAAGGAAGYGASKYGGSETQDPSMTSAYGQHATSNNPQDVSYMNRSAGGMDPSATTSATQPGTTTMGSSQPATGMGNTSPTSSGAGSGSGGMGSGLSNADPRKMGGAYEAGYRDAMEHAKAEMGLK